MTAAALLVAAAAALAQQGGAHGWRCSVSIAVDDYQGGMWRDFGQGAENAPYIMQVHGPGGPSNRHNVTWTVDPRSGGPPPNKKDEFLSGRKESEAFGTGPDYVHIDFNWDSSAIGPVWAHYWGDGVYAGADMLYTARAVRRSTGKDGKLLRLSGGLANRTVLAALAPASRWAVVASDATGKALFSKSFDVPRWRRAEAEYRRAREAIDRLEPRFRVDHEDLRGGDASCADNPDPIGEI